MGMKHRACLGGKVTPEVALFGGRQASGRRRQVLSGIQAQQAVQPALHFVPRGVPATACTPVTASSTHLYAGNAGTLNRGNGCLHCSFAGAMR